MLRAEELHVETGYLTFSPNVIEQNGDEICVTCDIRYPATMKKEDILKPIKESGVEF